MKNVLATAALAAMIANPVAAFAAAGGGSSTGNGGGDPTVAYSPAAVQDTGMRYNLDYLQLTPAEIAKRDKQLAPIYKMYTQITAASVVNALEKTYGMHVFVADWTQPDSVSRNMSDKRTLMDQITRYYAGGESSFDKADASAVPFKGIVAADRGSVAFQKLSGNDNFPKERSYDTEFLLTTKDDSQSNWGILWDRTHHALYTSTADPLYEVPTVDRLFRAMAASRLRGLDATVVLLTTDLQSVNQKYQVVYPTYSALAPIPTPVVYISRSATVEDIEQMLAENAPRIFAYNKLFNMQALPDVESIEAVLAKYPNILAEVQKQVGEVRHENFVNAFHSALLAVAFGTGAVVASPALLGGGLLALITHPGVLGVVVQNTVVVLH